MLAKSLSFLADADAAGIVLGARVPIILTSRADSVPTRLASCAVAALFAQARREDLKKAVGVMADAIAVLNAGSSSIKFSLFAQAGGELALKLRGQVEAIHTAPRFVAKDAAGETVSSHAWDEGTPLGPRRCAGAHRGLRARAAWSGSSLAGHRAPRRARRARLRAAGARRPQGAGRSGAVRAAGAAAPAAQPDADPASARAPAGAAAGGLLRHLLPSRAAGAGADVRAAQGSARRRACAATASMACPTSTSPRCCRSSTPGRRAAAPWSCTWATAPACARCPPAAASPARWASPRSTGCRWARAAAPSIRASSCT